jgi:hypothetical protein
LKDQPRRLSDRIADPAFLDGIESLSTEDLRSAREELEELEAEISYTRRLLQGKLDILRDELERRAAGGDADVRSLVERLPQILGDGAPGAGGRHLRILVPRNAERQRREVERVASDTTLAHIDELSFTKLNHIMEGLASAETQASGRRREIQEVSDRIRAELVRRYREGREDPTQLLST